MLDEAAPYELSMLLNAIHLSNKDSWEQARSVAFVTAQVNSSKKLSPTDVLRFSWEAEDEESKAVPAKKEDIARLARKAKEYEKYLK